MEEPRTTIPADFIKTELLSTGKDVKHLSHEPSTVDSSKNGDNASQWLSNSKKLSNNHCESPLDPANSTNMHADNDTILEDIVTVNCFDESSYSKSLNAAQIVDTSMPANEKALIKNEKTDGSHGDNENIVVESPTLCHSYDVKQNSDMGSVEGKADQFKGNCGSNGSGIEQFESKHKKMKGFTSVATSVASTSKALSQSCGQSSQKVQYGYILIAKPSRPVSDSSAVSLANSVTNYIVSNVKSTSVQSKTLFALAPFSLSSGTSNSQTSSNIVSPVLSNCVTTTGSATKLFCPLITYKSGPAKGLPKHILPKTTSVPVMLCSKESGTTFSMAPASVATSNTLGMYRMIKPRDSMANKLPLQNCHGLPSTGNSENYKNGSENSLKTESFTSDNKCEIEKCFIDVLEVPQLSRGRISIAYQNPLISLQRSYCFYCSLKVSRIVQHFRKSHQREKYVNEALSLPVGDAKRLKVLRHLKRSGIYSHNFNVISMGKGEILLPPGNRDGSATYLVCLCCRSLLRKRVMKLHYKNCTSGYTNRKCKVSNFVIQKTASENLQPSFSKSILAPMASDKVTNLLLNDKVLMKYGEDIFDESLDHHACAYIRSHLRRIATLVYLMKTSDSSLSGVVDLIDVLKIEQIKEKVKRLQAVEASIPISGLMQREIFDALISIADGLKDNDEWKECNLDAFTKILRSFKEFSGGHYTGRSIAEASKTASIQVSNGGCRPSTTVLPSTTGGISSISSQSNYFSMQQSSYRAHGIKGSNPRSIVPSFTRTDILNNSDVNNSQLYHPPKTLVKLESKEPLKLPVTPFDVSSLKEKKLKEQNHCLFCAKLLGSSLALFRRHMYTNHKDIQRIKELGKLPKSSKEKSGLLEKLRREGNEKHSKQVDQINTDKSSVKGWSKNKCSICVYCKSSVLREELAKHVRKCFETKTQDEQLSQIASILSSAQSETNYSKYHDEALKTLAREDNLLLLLGKIIYAENPTVENLNQICNEVKQLSRMIFLMQKKDKALEKMEDILVSRLVPDIVKACQTLSGVSRGGNQTDISLFQRLITNLRKAVIIRILNLKKLSDESGIDDCQNFLIKLQSLSEKCLIDQNDEQVKEEAVVKEKVKQHTGNKRWTALEREVVSNFMQRFIHLKITPTRKDCEDCMKSHLLLKDRQWGEIKQMVKMLISLNEKLDL